MKTIQLFWRLWASDPAQLRRLMQDYALIALFMAGTVALVVFLIQFGFEFFDVTDFKAFDFEWVQLLVAASLLLLVLSVACRVIALCCLVRLNGRGSSASFVVQQEKGNRPYV
jgi:hypothetical protein